MRKQVANPFTTLTVLFELPSRLDYSTFIAVTTTTKCFDCDRLPIHANHVGLVVKRVDVAWTAVHE